MSEPRSRTRGWLAMAAAGAAACHPGAPARTAELARTPLAAAGPVVAAVELADAVYLFAPDRVTIERGGAAVLTVAAPDGRWAEAVAMPALDGPGAWVVARTTTGGLWRITLAGDLAPIHDRLGLPPRVRSIAASISASGAVSGAASGAGSDAASGAGSGAAWDATVAIALDDGIAILRDRAHIARYPADAPGSVIASRDRVAVRRADVFDVWNLADGTHAGYTVPGAIAAGFVDRLTARLTTRPATRPAARPAARPAPTGPGAPAPSDHSALVVATRSALYIEADRRLHRWPAPAEITGLAVAGSRLWVATARGILVVEGDAFVPTAVAPAAADHLFGLAGGDLVLAAPAGVVRLAIGRAHDDPQWQAEVRPIFERVCARCHRPGGTARVDLSTVAAWRSERGELVRRVVETRTMPPAGTPLGDADRDVLAGWLSR